MRSPVETAVSLPYVFVVGCPRSGTTLLQRMLDAHPDLAVANDTHFIPRAVHSVVGGSAAEACSPARKDRLVRWTRDYHRFPRLGLDAEAVERSDAASRTYPQFVSALYAELAQQRGKPLAGEKTPDYVRYLPLLHRLFPRTRTVHIIRDGRDVALSLLEWATPKKGPGRLSLWRREPVGVCALWWRSQVEGQRHGPELPTGSYLEVKYERLVASSREILERISEFLGLRFADEMLAFHRGKLRRAPGLSAKKAWLPPTPGLRDWRAQLDPRSIELFEELAGDRLVANGYPLASRGASPEVRRAADDCRRWWREHFPARRSAATEVGA